MFELLQLSGSDESGIALETRHRNPVVNSQAAEPSEHDIRVFDYILSQHPKWKLRTPACGIYNCFGHVWAARRTAIYDQTAVETIMRDDGYRKLRSTETLLHGDIALYYDPTSESLWHVGLICELQSLVTPQGVEIATPVAWVLSKLNDVMGEVLHHSRDVHLPYDDGNVVVEFWTDRPV